MEKNNKILAISAIGLTSLIIASMMWGKRQNNSMTSPTGLIYWHRRSF